MPNKSPKSPLPEDSSNIELKNAPQTRVSGRVWKGPKKPMKRNNHLKLGTNSWNKRLEQRSKNKVVKALEKQMKDETEDKKKLKGERLKELRLKKELKLKEDMMRASMSDKRYQRIKRREARKEKIALKKAEKTAEIENF